MRGRSLLLAAAALALVAGCGGSPYGGEYAPAPTATSPTPQAQMQPVTPVLGGRGLIIEKIGVHTELVPLGLNSNGTHEVPPVDSPMVAGWYEPGPEPGQPGPSIILGHVNGGGVPGVFARLSEMQVGDQIMASGKVYTVYRVGSFPKDEFPAMDVYGEVPGAEFRLITCGGAFDEGTGHYRDNFILWAR